MKDYAYIACLLLFLGICILINLFYPIFYSFINDIDISVYYEQAEKDAKHRREIMFFWLKRAFIIALCVGCLFGLLMLIVFIMRTWEQELSDFMDEYYQLVYVFLILILVILLTFILFKLLVWISLELGVPIDTLKKSKIPRWLL